MINLMDHEENGGNGDELVTEDEFLSFLGTQKKCWSSTNLSVLNKYRPWSLLWEHLAWFNRINLGIRKKDYVVDTRLNRDMFLSDHLFSACCAISLIGWIIYICYSKKVGSIYKFVCDHIVGKYEVEYDYKLNDLREINDKNERDAKIHPSDWINKEDEDDIYGLYYKLDEDELKNMRDDLYYSEKLQGDDVFELEAALCIKNAELKVQQE